MTSGTLPTTSMVKRVALVTGSTSGIGLGIARRLGDTGCDVIITGIADGSTVDEILNSFKRDYSGTFTFIEGDLRSEAEIEKLCEAVIAKYSDGIDILINNAGINYTVEIDEYPINKWHELIAVNLTAPFLLTRFFLPFMKRKGWGRIVNTASMMGLVSMPKRVPYSTTKAGLIGMTKGVALECAEHGVTCNAVCPGFVFTDILKNLVEETAKTKSISFEDAKTKFFKERNPTKQPITIEQVAGLVTYLCSDEASSITGSALTMDAGYTAQ